MILAALLEGRRKSFAIRYMIFRQSPYESSNVAYRVFRKMLESGNPPDDWSQLLAEARAEGQRLQQSAAGNTV